MSRIAKKGIVLADKVEVSIVDGVLKVKGPKGELSRSVPTGFEISIEDKIIFPKINESANQDLDGQAGVFLGTFTSILNSLIKGVTTGFTKKLILEGVGYRSEVKGKEMVFALGFSHPVKVSIPEGLTVTADKNIITVSGIDKDKVGQYAAYIRDLKKPEPYKGKGMRYDGEVIRMKEGKKSV